MPDSTATNGVPSDAEQSTPMWVRPPLRGSPNESEHELRRRPEIGNVSSAGGDLRRRHRRPASATAAARVLHGAMRVLRRRGRRPNGRPSDCAPARAGPVKSPIKVNATARDAHRAPAASPSS